MFGQPEALIAPALGVAREAMQLLASLGTIEAGEALIRLVYAEALWTERDPRTGAAVIDARDRLLAQASRIGARVSTGDLPSMRARNRAGSNAAARAMV